MLNSKWPAHMARVTGVQLTPGSRPPELPSRSTESSRSSVWMAVSCPQSPSTEPQSQAAGGSVTTPPYFSSCHGGAVPETAISPLQSAIYIRKSMMAFSRVTEVKSTSRPQSTSTSQEFSHDHPGPCSGHECSAAAFAFPARHQHLHRSDQGLRRPRPRQNRLVAALPADRGGVLRLRRHDGQED